MKLTQYHRLLRTSCPSAVRYIVCDAFLRTPTVQLFVENMSTNNYVRFKLNKTTGSVTEITRSYIAVLFNSIRKEEAHATVTRRPQHVPSSPFVLVGPFHQRLVVIPSKL